MSAAISDDYAAGYADGVRDAAAWTAKCAAEIPGPLARQLRKDAEGRWLQCADRYDWPAWRRLVGKARRGHG